MNQYFHVCDNSANPRSGQPGYDKLAHVKSIMETLCANMKQEFRPHKEVSIDEAMVDYNGRLGFKQYVPLKPTKRGIKVWVRADPNNGYVNDFQVYTGKENGVVEKGLGERVALDLSLIFGENITTYNMTIISHLCLSSKSFLCTRRMLVAPYEQIGKAYIQL